MSNNISFVRVDGHRSKTSSVRKNTVLKDTVAGTVPDDLRNFRVLKKCQNKFDCLVDEMLLNSRQGFV